ncbi:MAG: hypothetical protein IPI32_11645 [Austwickia sp.]|nr:hypothetical protein [Austwickia sp.]MBK8435865.1 hypothetical protein [Austwickia sp.]
MRRPADPSVDPREAAHEALFAVRFYRRGRTPPLGQDRFTNAYVAVVGVVTFASMFASGIIGLAAPQECVERVCRLAEQAQASALPWALLAVGAGLWLTGAAGPIGASQERLTWLLGSPADRGVLLRVRYRVSLVLAGAMGATLAVIPLLATIDPSAGAPVTALVWTAVAGAGGGVVVVAVGTVVQAAGSLGPGVLTRLGQAGVALGGLLAVVAAFGLSLPAIPALSADGAPALPATVTVAIAVVLARRGRGMLASLSVATLHRAGRFTGAFGDAVLALDATPATIMVAARRAESRGRFRSRPVGGTGAAALLRSDIRRALRRPGVLTAMVLLVPLPMLVAAVINSMAAVIVLGMASAAWTRSAAAGYLAWARSTGLRRMLGLPGHRAAPALLALPAAGVAAWTALGTALAGLPLIFVVAFVACGIASTLDAGAEVKPADLGVIISTPMGAVPVGLVQRVTSGTLLVALCVIPLLLTSSPLAVLVSLAVLAFQVSSHRRPR